MLNNVYVNPVVIMGGLTYNGRDPSTVRVNDVTEISFNVQIQEWSYLDGPHAEETVSYLVAEAGHHVLEDGTIYEAGVVSVDSSWA
jgi:hypothetical protein